VYQTTTDDTMNHSTSKEIVENVTKNCQSEKRQKEKLTVNDKPQDVSPNLYKSFNQHCVKTN